jgi:hypothetical protein
MFQPFFLRHQFVLEMMLNLYIANIKGVGLENKTKKRKKFQK